MKMCFARAKTASAIAAVLTAAAVSSPVYAVSHSDTGLGDVGLIPYYTVRDQYDTNISVVNTSDTYVVSFKIRFREGSNSRDARDFNVFLSPNDVWTATVSMGDNGVPYIQTADTSCTAPWITTNRQTGFVVVGQTAGGQPIKQIDMTTIGYAGGSVFVPDDGPSSIERAQEGYVEVIEMGVALPDPSVLASYAVHGPTQDCATLAGVYAPVNNEIVVTGSGIGCEVPVAQIGDTVSGNAAFQAEFCEPLNVLKVASNLIKVDEGVAAGMPVSILSNFYNPTGVDDPTAPAPGDLSEDPQSINPNLNSADPAASVQIADGLPITASFFGNQNPGADAVSSLISATDVINEYAVCGAAVAQNAWVLTFPTKNFYVDVFENPAAPIVPFENPYDNGVSCVTVGYEYFDREEGSPDNPIGEVLPSPPPVVVIPPNSVCDESLVLNFGTESLLGSQHNYIVELEDGFTSGWMRLNFPFAGTIFDDSGIGFTGLPTIGFSMKTLNNGVVDNALRSYGISSVHAYDRDISIAEPTPGGI